MIEGTEANLTGPQHRFAKRNAAVPFLTAPADESMVFMYRTDGTRTTRWLVNSAGSVIDITAFTTSATAA
jgi:hypothetical protein